MINEDRRVNEDESISCKNKRICSPFPRSHIFERSSSPFTQRPQVSTFLRTTDQVAQILFAAAHDRFCFLFITFFLPFAESYSHSSVWFSLGQISLSIWYQLRQLPNPLRAKMLSILRTGVSKSAIMIPQDWLQDFTVANAHNMLIRCLNSIYLQAPYVKEKADIQDLLQYSLFWEKWIQ